MGAIRKRLTYANVIATAALFLALGGGVVWAAGKIGTKKLKANAVTAAKIRRNAVTTVKIRANAVTATKIKNEAVSFAKLATGTNLVLSVTSPPVAASGTTPIAVPLAGRTSFAPAAGTLDQLNVEVRGNLQRTGAEPCKVTVVPFVNGSAWEFGEGRLTVSAFAPTPEEPTGIIPAAGATGPIGLASPGATQTVAAKLFPDADCTAASTVTVGIAVTQLK
jgi:hypothetical protein